MRTERLDVDLLRPKFLDQPDRYNNWYFTVHFEHEGKAKLAKLSIAEGSLLGQRVHLTLSEDPLSLKEEEDLTLLLPPERDFMVHQPNPGFDFATDDEEVRIQMGDMTIICREDEQRVISKNERLGADLTFTPRGPILFWNHEPGAVCDVTEVTRVSGCESLSDVKGTLTLDGEEIEIEGRGLFERVWFSALNFLEIRAMNWIYAHFDNAYLYLCHCESVTGESTPFHFETGDIYLGLDDELLPATSLEVMPERWVFMKETHRFIPVEQTVIMGTEKGTLKMNVRLRHYPVMIQDPVRLEGLTIDNVPGWTTLFYDGPVEMDGKFVYKDGTIIELKDGYGLNEVIRISAL